MPLEVQGHTVPHLKALISGKSEPRGLRCGSTFILCYVLLKTAILLHTEGLVKTEMANTVTINTLQVAMSRVGNLFSLQRDKVGIAYTLKDEEGISNISEPSSCY